MNKNIKNKKIMKNIQKTQNQSVWCSNIHPHNQQKHTKKHIKT